jgi:ubiquinone/menaquinone biosynthesis C-methylase UbiE
MKKQSLEFWNKPFFYRLHQVVFAPGANIYMKKIIQSLLPKMSNRKKILDVGCGPASWLFQFGLKPVGLDIDPNFIHEYKKYAEAYIGSADNLPFAENTFDSVWSIGLLHHLPTPMAQQAVKEMMKVCKKDGQVIIIDAVLPVSAIRRPLAWLTRKIDNGKFIRKSEENKKLFPDLKYWKIQRHTYAYTGLELLVFQFAQ